MSVTGTGACSVSYTYDANNRLSTEIKTSSNPTESTVYSYDNNGNQTSKVTTINGVATTVSNTYNGFNQLTGSTAGGATSVYSYDPSGLRINKTAGGTATRFILDGANVALELNGSTVTANYIRGINLIYSTISGAPKYYMYNAHGDVVQLTDTAGAVVKSYNYDAFGVEKNIDANDPNPFRYCGEYYDLSSGTYYLRARYYDPTTGRFLSEDSYLGDTNDPLSLNLYTYCLNNPVMYIDPTGYWEETDSKYSTTVQIELLKLTLAWYLADNKEVKDDIHNQAEAIRERFSSGKGKVADTIKKITGAAADEFAWFLGGDVSASERDYWLTEAISRNYYKRKYYLTSFNVYYWNSFSISR
jgi:RHS repeat-associated protein